MKDNYENYFEVVEDKAIVISDLIEQIFLVDEVISSHQKVGSEGYEIEQYVERKAEYRTELNYYLGTINLMIVDRKVA